MPQTTLPLLAKLWFLAVTPVVVVDAIFVLMRSKRPDVPHPLSKTIPFSYWTLYAEYDRRYAPNDDAFVVAQAWLNLVEVLMGVVAVLFSVFKANNIAIKLALFVSLMTFYKTVLYFLIDIAESGKYTHHNTFPDHFLVVIAPSSLWIIVPAIIMKKCFMALMVSNTPSPSKAGRTRSHMSPQQPADQQRGSHKSRSDAKKKG